MHRRRNIVIALIAALAAVALIVAGLVLTRPAPSGTTAAVRPARQSKTAAPALTDDDVRTVTAFEHAWHDFGSDPALADTDTPQGQDFVARTRWDGTLDRTALDAVSTIRTAKDAGPDTKSPYCTKYPGSDMCGRQSDMKTYWHMNEWTLGARLVPDSLRVSVEEDGWIRVEGRVRLICWTGIGDDTPRETTSQLTPWWGYDPWTGTRGFSDALKVGDGKVVQRKDTGETVWMAEPFALPWSVDPASSIDVWDDVRQADIPVSGPDPDQALMWTDAIDRTPNHGSFGPLWDQVPAHNTIPADPQTQQDPNLDPQADHDRLNP